MNRGKLAVATIVLLGLALAAFAWWWRYSQQRQSRAFAFWGREGALRIERAKKVELVRLAADGAAEERLDIGGTNHAVIAWRDVSGAPGLIHARHALLEDASFVWDDDAQSANAAARRGHYTFAVTFRDQSGATTVAFDPAGRQVTCVQTGRSLTAVPRILDGWRTFADRHAPPAPVRQRNS
jgi:hypothetical protein